MNFVEQYYEFKRKWYFKIGSLLFDFYINKEPNNLVQKIKYEYLQELIDSYINKEEIDDSKISLKISEVNSSAFNKLEFELLKYVIYVSENYTSTKFTQNDYIYFAMLLEITIQLYNSAFIGVNQNVATKILKENLFRFEFVDFKKKQTKMNLLLRYLKYINNNESRYFSNLKNKRVEINITALSNHHNYFIIDIINKLPDFTQYDEELVESVEKNNEYLNRLFLLNFNLLVEQLVFLLEKEKFAIDKVIFNLDKYKYNRDAIKYINTFSSVMNKHIMFSSQDKKKLDIISNQYSKCIYINKSKIEKVLDYKDMNVIVKKSFWNTNKKEAKRYNDINFITVNDNIIYKLEEEK